MKTEKQILDEYKRLSDRRVVIKSIIENDCAIVGNPKKYEYMDLLIELGIIDYKLEAFEWVLNN